MRLIEIALIFRRCCKTRRWVTKHAAGNLSMFKNFCEQPRMLFSMLEWQQKADMLHTLRYPGLYLECAS